MKGAATVNRRSLPMYSGKARVRLWLAISDACSSMPSGSCVSSASGSVDDEAWLQGEFLTTVQKRGAAVIEAVQEDGTCWLSGTTWHGMGAMRISVSNWSTTDDDVGRSLEAIVRAARIVRSRG